jgi:hypothetical protein
MIPARDAGDQMKRFVEGMDRGQGTLLKGPHERVLKKFENHAHMVAIFCKE